MANQTVAQVRGYARGGGVTTFDFGGGPVPAHRHPNGGGWVADTARVDATAYVGPDAVVCDNAVVYDNARVCGSAQVGDNAQVGDSAQVYDNAVVGDNAQVRSACSVTPLVLTGLEYDVTICDEQIHVGCRDGDIVYWRTATPERCPMLESEREVILWIAHRHQARVRGDVETG